VGSQTDDFEYLVPLVLPQYHVFPEQRDRAAAMSDPKYTFWYRNRSFDERHRVEKRKDEVFSQERGTTVPVIFPDV
jgi:hypothetical protein